MKFNILGSHVKTEIDIFSSMRSGKLLESSDILNLIGITKTNLSRIDYETPQEDELDHCRITMDNFVYSMSYGLPPDDDE